MVLKYTLLSFIPLAILGSGLPTQAEATNLADVHGTAAVPSQDTESTATIDFNRANLDREVADRHENLGLTTTSSDVVKAESVLDTTALTSASALMTQPEETQSPELQQTQNLQPEAVSETSAPVVAQVGVTPGRATRSGPSYVGVAGNIGVSGRTALSRGNFTVISKLGLTRNFSARPSAVIGDRTVFLLPLTLDFPIEQVENIEQLSIAPYIGGGVAISTGRDSRVGPLISGGVDVPVAQDITATAGVNVGFLRRTDVGVLIGVGYTF